MAYYYLSAAQADNEMKALLAERNRLWSLYMSLDQGAAADCVMYAYHNICDRIAELDRK